MSDNLISLVGFAADVETQQRLAQLADSLAPQHIEVKKGDLDKVIEWCGKNSAPEILIVDAGNCVNLEGQLRRLANYLSPTTQLIVLGEQSDVALYRSLMFAGVGDYHSKPLDVDAMRLSIMHLQGHSVNAPIRKGKVVAVVGTGGGLGVSTIASNLAFCFAEKQKQHVALLDLNLYHSQHPILLGADYEPHLKKLIGDANRIDATLLAHSSQEISPRLHAFYDENQFLNSDQEAQLSQCITALAEHYGTVTLDIPNLTQSANLELVQQADICLLVTDYSLSSLRMIKKLQSQLVTTRQRLLVVANQSRDNKGRAPKAEFEKALESSISFELPFDSKGLAKSEALGKPLVLQSSKLGKKLTKLATFVVGSVE